MVKSYSEFHKNKASPLGIHTICKKCRNVYYKKHWEDNYKEKKLLKNYGLTLEEFDQMSENQNNVCAICGKPNYDNRRLCVDHNHITNKIRGLLCSKCNRALGLLNSDNNGVETMNKIIEYLSQVD